MIKTIKTLSTEEMKHLINTEFRVCETMEYDKTYIISILGSGETPLFGSSLSVLTVSIDDINPTSFSEALEYEKIGFKTFLAYTHADQLKNYLNSIKDTPGENILLIHDYEGTSRSCAIAIAACEHFNISPDILLISNPFLSPNAWILDAMNIDNSKWSQLIKTSKNRLFCSLPFIPK